MVAEDPWVPEENELDTVGEDPLDEEIVEEDRNRQPRLEEELMQETEVVIVKEERMDEEEENEISMVDVKEEQPLEEHFVGPKEDEEKIADPLGSLESKLCPVALERKNPSVKKPTTWYTLKIKKNAEVKEAAVVKEQVFVCKYCPGKSILKVHKNLTRNFPIFQCDKCLRTFVTGQTVSKHIVPPALVSRFKCEECQMAFKRRMDLNSHKLTHYYSGVEKYCKCHQCKLRALRIVAGSTTSPVRMVQTSKFCHFQSPR